MPGVCIVCGVVCFVSCVVSGFVVCCLLRVLRCDMACIVWCGKYGTVCVLCGVVSDVCCVVHVACV